jgi:hypothetical protein
MQLANASYLSVFFVSLDKFPEYESTIQAAKPARTQTEFHPERLRIWSLRPEY